MYLYVFHCAATNKGRHSEAGEAYLFLKASSNTTRQTANLITMPEKQSWTESGYPIVDGKYLDKDGNIQQFDSQEWSVAGPPALDVYWHNRRVTPGREQDQFRTLVSNAFVDMTEYIARIGELLRTVGASCELVSLNATKYSVTIIISTESSQEEMKGLLLSCRLAPAH